MQTIKLHLTTAEGHQLGVLPLSGFQVADPNEHASAGPLRPADAVEALERQIRAALEGEGLAPAGDEIEIQISIARVVLDAARADSLEIPLTVRDLAPPTKTAEPGSSTTLASKADDLFEGLFDLNDLVPAGGKDDLNE